MLRSILALVLASSSFACAGKMKVARVAVRDGSRTGGRTVRALFKGGTGAAAKEAKKNAAITKTEVKEAKYEASK